MPGYRSVAARTNAAVVAAGTVVETAPAVVVVDAVVGSTVSLPVVSSDNFPSSPYFPPAAVSIG